MGNISKEKLIETVAAGFDSYRPNPDVLGQLGQVDLTLVTAPSGMGKDTVMAASGLRRLLAETIREPRMNNGVAEQDGIEYEFRGHELDAVLKDYLEGNYVQIGMGPSKKSFYASRAANYPESGPLLMDVMTNQVRPMKVLPFSSIEAVQITAPNYDVWLQRFTARGNLAEDEIRARMDEAETSISDGLEDESYVFIMNDEVELAASSLRIFAETREYEQHLQTIARNAAHSILTQLRRV